MYVNQQQRYSNQTSLSTKISKQQSFHNTYYLSLEQEDEIEYYRHSKGTTKSFQFVINTILKDFNYLLYIDQQTFWQHLQYQSQKQQMMELNSQEQVHLGSLRMSLESCLEVFCRKKYMIYGESVEEQYIQEVQNIQESLKPWYELKLVVLTIFYRIASAKTALHRQIMFQNWYLDNIKLLNICMIYGQQNREIVETIIQKTHFCFPKDFFEDFKTILDKFQWRLYHLCDATANCKVDLQNFYRANNQQRQFENAYQAIHDLIFQFMYGIVDILLNLECIMAFFPKHCKLYVVQSTILYKRLIVVYYKSREGLDKRNKQDLLANKLNAYVELIKAKIAQFFGDSLIFMREQVQKQPNASKKIFSKIKTTYINIGYHTLSAPAMMYSDRQNQGLKQAYKGYGRQLMQSLVLYKPKEKKMAVKSMTKLFDYNHQGIEYVKKMVFFEQKLRNQIKNMQELNKMEHWRMKSLKQFEMMLQGQKQDRNQQREQKKPLKKVNLIEYQDQPDQNQQKQSYFKETDNFEAQEQQIDKICSYLQDCYDKYVNKNLFLRRLELASDPIPLKQSVFCSYEDLSLFSVENSDSGITKTEYSQSEQFKNDI